MAKYQEITGDLKSAIEQGRLRPGERLPTVNELRRQYEVSHITIVRVFKELSQAGLIEALGGSGYTVRKGPQAAQRTGVIANFNRPLRATTRMDNFLNDINIHLEMECLNRELDLWRSHTTRPLNMRPVSDAALAAVTDAMIEAAPRVDGYFVDEFIPDSWLEPVLKKTGKPMVVINRLTDLPLDSVTPPNRGGIQAMMDLAVKMGYEQFIFCTKNVYVANFEIRTAAFREYVRKRKIAQVEYLNWNNEAELTGGLDELVRGGKRPLVFCISDYVARSCVKWAQEHELVLGRDLGVSGFDGFDTAYEKPELTTVKSSPETIAALAVDLLQRRIANEYNETPGNHTSEVLIAPGSTI